MSWAAEPIPGGGWQYKHSDSDAHITVDYLIPKGSGLEAWVELRLGDADRPVASGTRNLMLPDAAVPFLRSLPDDTHSLWREGLTVAFFDTVEAFRESVATVDLAAVELRPFAFLVEPLMESGNNTRLIAPGGSGKSLLGLALALTVATGDRRFLGLRPEATGPVMYLDWETDEFTHRRRMEDLCRAAGVPVPGLGHIHYRQEALPLIRTVQAVTRAARAVGAVMLIVDSRIPAAGASGQSSGEDSSINLNSALRQIGVPALILDHKSQEKIEKGKTGGYGSITNQNFARMEWEFTKHQRMAPNDYVFRLSLEKKNNVGDLPPLGFRLQFSREGTAFTRINPDKIVDPTAEDTTAERMFTLFTGETNEPLTTGKIAAMLDVPADTVRSAGNRDPRFRNLRKGQKGKEGLWEVPEEFLTGPPLTAVQTTIEEVVLDDEPDEHVDTGPPTVGRPSDDEGIDIF